MNIRKRNSTAEIMLSTINAAATFSTNLMNQCIRTLVLEFRQQWFNAAKNSVESGDRSRAFDRPRNDRNADED